MDDLILYVLVRTDMESMKYGKGAAQVGHACNQFTDDEIICPLLAGGQPNPDAMAWRAQAGAFGTTFTLAAPNLRAMQDTIEAAKVLGFKADPVIDPDYPYLVPNELMGRLDVSKFTKPPMMSRGKTLCFTEETTCAYVFGHKPMLEVLLARYEPLPNE